MKVSLRGGKTSALSETEVPYQVQVLCKREIYVMSFGYVSLLINIGENINKSSLKDIICISTNYNQ